MIHLMQMLRDAPQMDFTGMKKTHPLRIAMIFHDHTIHGRSSGSEQMEVRKRTI